MSIAAALMLRGWAVKRPVAALNERVRAEQIHTLFAQWRRTTLSMLLGSAILTVVMWGAAPPSAFVAWIAAIIANQVWRYALTRRYHALTPVEQTHSSWGYAWALGSLVAGALWGIAGAVLYSAGDVGHQALLIVCLFGVVLGGVDLTSVFKPSFYGFVVPALAPLTLRVALQGDQVHLFLAAVMLVVLAFILRFGRNLNHLMAQSLAIRYENVDLIDELRTQRLAADAARATAEAANRGKTQFLAAASHDLRQPLHALGLFGAALSAKVCEPEVREIVGSINASVEALERLFSTLMDISKLDAGAVAPVRTPFPLMPMFRRLAQQFAPLAQSRGLRLRFVETVAWVESDAVLLERILSNLVANALHHSERGGAIVGLRHRDGHAWIDVIDSGPGIAPRERERVFEEFFRGSPRGGRSQGMGLGLAIVRRLAALLGHEVALFSVEARGSRFSVQIPRVRAALPLPSNTQPPAPQRDARPLSGALIAIVDDEPAVLDGMRACLSQWGAEVVGGVSGDAVVAALGECGRYPDLIIADYRLANEELGTAVIERLRDEFGIAIPAMLVSGDASAPAIAAMRVATLDLLLKPVTADELRLRAESCLMAGRRGDAEHAKKSAPVEGAPEDRLSLG
ncbi:MAG: hybrid sensor histidine kinase/response regulator [Betaproteobacteria bacterium]